MYSTKIMQLEIDQERPYVITIKALLEDSSNYFTRIGSFNFLYNEGSIKQFNGTYRDVKRFSTILNHFAKHNEFFTWNSNVVEQAKQNAKEVKKQEKKEAEAAAKQLQVERANELLSKLNNKDESLNEMVTSLQELTDNEVLERINNTFKNNINEELVNEILLAIQSYFTTQTNINDQPQQEVFHLYNNIFTSYKEAYNYALDNDITVTMILSSKHPTMANERLQQLEKEYIFTKHNMPIGDMKEYYEYIQTCPLSLDKEDRYYKLQSLIQRYENKQERIRQRKEEELQLAKQDKELMDHMISNGLIIDSRRYMTKYILNNETIHIWSGGSLSVIEYHNMISNMYNNHFQNNN